MILRSVSLFLALFAFSAAPVLAIGPSAGVGGTNTATAAGGSTRVTPGQAVTAPDLQSAADCTRSLRSFVGRNTMQPSVRRQALRDCQDKVGSEDWAARSR